MLVETIEVKVHGNGVSGHPHTRVESLVTTFITPLMLLKQDEKRPKTEPWRTPEKTFAGAEL